MKKFLLGLALVFFQGFGLSAGGPSSKPNVFSFAKKLMKRKSHEGDFQKNGSQGFAKSSGSSNPSATKSKKSLLKSFSSKIKSLKDRLVRNWKTGGKKAKAAIVGAGGLVAAGFSGLIYWISSGESKPEKPGGGSNSLAVTSSGGDSVDSPEPRPTSHNSEYRPSARPEATLSQSFSVRPSAQNLPGSQRPSISEKKGFQSSGPGRDSSKPRLTSSATTATPSGESGGVGASDDEEVEFAVLNSKFDRSNLWDENLVVDVWSSGGGYYVSPKATFIKQLEQAGDKVIRALPDSLGDEGLDCKVAGLKRQFKAIVDLGLGMSLTKAGEGFGLLKELASNDPNCSYTFPNDAYPLISLVGCSFLLNMSDLPHSSRSGSEELNGIRLELNEKLELIQDSFPRQGGGGNECPIYTTLGLICFSRGMDPFSGAADEELLCIKKYGVAPNDCDDKARAFLVDNYKKFGSQSFQHKLFLESDIYLGPSHNILFCSGSLSPIYYFLKRCEGYINRRAFSDCGNLSLTGDYESLLLSEDIKKKPLIIAFNVIGHWISLKVERRDRTISVKAYNSMGSSVLDEKALKVFAYLFSDNYKRDFVGPALAKIVEFQKEKEKEFEPSSSSACSSTSTGSTVITPAPKRHSASGPSSSSGSSPSSDVRPMASGHEAAVGVNSCDKKACEAYLNNLACSKLKVDFKYAKGVMHSAGIDIGKKAEFKDAPKGYSAFCFNLLKTKSCFKDEINKVFNFYSKEKEDGFSGYQYVGKKNQVVEPRRLCLAFIILKIALCCKVQDDSFFELTSSPNSENSVSSVFNDFVTLPLLNFYKTVFGLADIDDRVYRLYLLEVLRSVFFIQGLCLSVNGDSEDEMSCDIVDVGLRSLGMLDFMNLYYFIWRAYDMSCWDKKTRSGSVAFEAINKGVSFDEQDSIVCKAFAEFMLDVIKNP